MVAGYAFGIAVLHMMCDLTIAAENAQFGQTGPSWFFDEDGEHLIWQE